MSHSNNEKTNSVTTLLVRVRAGDSVALEDLFHRVYPDLKRLARSIVARRAKGPNTPSATTLVQDACRRIFEKESLNAESRRQFFRLFCRAMEDEWVERARHDLANKRRPKGAREPLTDFAHEAGTGEIDFAHLRQAVAELAIVDADAAEVVTLRFYCATTLQETADVMGSTLAVVRRNWSYAKAWLHEQLARDGN